MYNFIGARIKLLREKKQLQQEKLAQMLGVSQKTVSSWEVGRIEPSVKTLKKIAEFFDVSVDYFIGLDNKTREQFDIALRESIIKYMKLYGDIPYKIDENKDDYEKFEEERHLKELKEYDPEGYVRYITKKAREEVGLDITEDTENYDHSGFPAPYKDWEKIQSFIDNKIQIDKKTLEEIYNIEPENMDRYKSTFFVPVKDKIYGKKYVFNPDLFKNDDK